MSIILGTYNVPDIRKTGDQEADTVLALRELIVPKDHASLDHFSDEETETQIGKVTDARSHSW